MESAVKKLKVKMKLNSEKIMSKIVHVNVKKINKWCFKTTIENVYFVVKSIKYVIILSIV